MATDEFRYESPRDLEAIARYLKAIIQGLENGRLELSDDSGALLLHPAGLIKLEVRAKRRSNRARLQIKVAWREEKRKTKAESPRIPSG